MTPKLPIPTSSPSKHCNRALALRIGSHACSSSVVRSLLEDVESAAHQVKVPVVDAASLLDEVVPAVLAADQVGELDALDDVLGRGGRRADAGDSVGTELDGLLGRLQPDGAGDARQLLEPFGRELDDSLQGWVRAPALAGGPALAVGVLGDGRWVAVCVAVAGEGGGVRSAVLAARPETVAARGIEVVAAETLLREELVELVVLVPGGLAAEDGGVLVLSLGERCGSENERKGAGKGSGRDEDVVEGDHVGWFDDVDVDVLECR